MAPLALRTTGGGLPLGIDQLPRYVPLLAAHYSRQSPDSPGHQRDQSIHQRLRRVTVHSHLRERANIETPSGGELQLEHRNTIRRTTSHFMEM
jgi:hypothetical protein